ncbi:uromodulin-like [Dendropsophus ebraccatus]|uniref:uromodulin-like n=1 Tax=Dendropsophus ebraccatus TaxID=150705 RepID=UPI003831001A
MLWLLGSAALLAALGTAVVDAACTPACLPDEACTSLNNTACAANTTYYQSLGMSVSNVSTTVDCKGANMTVSVPKNLLEFLNYNPSASALSQNNCTGAVVNIVQGQRVYSLTVQTKEGTCGNTMMKNTTHVTFANSLYIPGLNSNGLITVGNISIQFSCTYNITMQTALYTVFKPVMTSQNLNSGGTGGDGTTTLAAYSSPSYTNPIQQSQQQVLPVGTTLYFGMITQFPDPAFVLRVTQCFATPTSDGTGSLKIQLIQGGCPVSGDGPNIQVVSNGVSKEVRFSITSFYFQGSDSVYIFCDAKLCQTASGTCASCSSSRDVSESPAQFVLGPFSFLDNSLFSSSSQKGVSVTLLLGSLLCFCIHLISQVI